MLGTVIRGVVIMVGRVVPCRGAARLFFAQAMDVCSRQHKHPAGKDQQPQHGENTLHGRQRYKTADTFVDVFLAT